MGHPSSGTRYATTELSCGARTDEEEKLVGCRSHYNHRRGDCCGHAAVKSSWRDMRGGYTEEQGRLLGNGRCPESGDKKTTAIPKDDPCSCLTYRAEHTCSARVAVNHGYRYLGGRKKLTLITELCSAYMEPLFYVSRCKIGEGDTGKRDYRHRVRTGWVYKR
jgi:hypothetical protein